MRPVEWLIEPFIPLGKVTVLAGQMGQGKSTLSAELAAKVTTGKTDVGAAASVLMFSAEEDPGDGIRPKLEAAEADSARVCTPAAFELKPQLIEDFCEEREDIRLITVDPIGDFLPAGVNAWKTPDMRRFLHPFVELAQRRGIALVFIQHFNRNLDSDDALSRIADSQGLPQVARSVLAWGPDPDDPDGDGGARKVLAVAKSNLVEDRPATSYRRESVPVAPGITAPRLVTLGGSSHAASDLLPGRKSRPADALLEAALADGPKLASVVEAEARDRGVSADQVRRARERLERRGAMSRRKRPGDGCSEWSMVVEVAI